MQPAEPMLLEFTVGESLPRSCRPRGEALSQQAVEILIQVAELGEAYVGHAVVERQCGLHADERPYPISLGMRTQQLGDVGDPLQHGLARRGCSRRRKEEHCRLGNDLRLLMIRRPLGATLFPYTTY